MILAQDFGGSPGFALSLAAKDLDLALSAAAQAHVALPVAETVRQKVTTLRAEVGENVDLTVIGRFSRGNAR
jgi:3-hydroxyisobutyrate dehydrogenase-like beta-hydroxyacid dehydrogenase